MVQKPKYLGHSELAALQRPSGPRENTHTLAGTHRLALEVDQV